MGQEARLRANGRSAAFRDTVEDFDEPAREGVFGTDDHQPILLDQAFDGFLGYTPSSPQQQQLYENALGMFQELNQAREHRETVASLRLPDAVRWFVFIGAGISVAAMWLLWLDSEVAHAIFTAAMTWVVVAASAIVLDLDNPYAGDFVVNWHRFHEVTARMERFHCPQGPEVEP